VRLPLGAVLAVQLMRGEMETCCEPLKALDRCRERFQRVSNAAIPTARPSVHKKTTMLLEPQEEAYVTHLSAHVCCAEG
jgi:hypothetical protein